MQHVDMKAAGGACIFWDAGVSDRQTLWDRLDAIGLGEYVPNQRTDAAALRGALQEYAIATKPRKRKGEPKRDKLVRPLADQDSFAVIDEEREETGNSYTADFSARVEDGEVKITRGYADVSVIQKQFALLKATIDGQAVGQCLAEMIGTLSGVLLRPNGGLWFLPDASLPLWEKIALAVEASGDKNRVYVMRTVMDAQTVRAVRDAIVSEVTEIASELAREVGSGDLGEQALENRIVKGKALHARVSTYEEILSESLSTLHQIIQVSETAAASALSIKQAGEVYEDLYA